MDSSDLMPLSQSAYHQYHSTETAMTKVYNDVLLAADGQPVTALCLLDLMAIFNTVDHDLLLFCLERRSPVVPFISAGQIVPCYLRRFHVDDDSHCVLGTTRFSIWSASVHFVQGGHSRSREEA